MRNHQLVLNYYPTTHGILKPFLSDLSINFYDVCTRIPKDHCEVRTGQIMCEVKYTDSSHRPPQIVPGVA